MNQNDLINGLSAGDAESMTHKPGLQPTALMKALSAIPSWLDKARAENQQFSQTYQNQGPEAALKMDPSRAIDLAGGFAGSTIAKPGPSFTEVSSAIKYLQAIATHTDPKSTLWSVYNSIPGDSIPSLVTKAKAFGWNPHVMNDEHIVGKFVADNFSHDPSQFKPFADYMKSTYKQIPITEEHTPEDVIVKALAKNPGASIFDVAGHPEMNAPGPSTRRQAMDYPVPDPVPWGTKGFPWPQGEQAERAQEAGLTTPVWHGKGIKNPIKPTSLIGSRALLPHADFFTSHNPDIGSMYAYWQTFDPRTASPHTLERMAEDAELSRGSPSVMPLLLNTKDMPALNVKGADYSEANPQAWNILDANKARGVTLHNVGDEPAGGHQTLGPQSVTILRGGGPHVRSPFAQFKDLKANDLLAGLAGTGLLPWLSSGDSNAQR